jgi:effector-binding domain-containing protein
MRPSTLVRVIIAIAALGLSQSGLRPAQAQETKPAAPATPPAAAAPPSAPSSAQTNGLTGEATTMDEQTIVFVSGAASWDNAFGTIVDNLKKVYAFLEKEKIKPSGPPMTIYTSTDDKGFEFDAAVPVASAPASPPTGDIKVGKSPSGKALKYTHRGSYDEMDSTYEAITNQLDDKGLEAKDVFVEVYRTDPRTTPADKLEIEVYVPIK